MTATDKPCRHVFVGVPNDKRHRNALAALSGAAQPSQADELLTRNLKDALALVDVKVLDHFIVASREALSFAERGLL